MHSAGSHVYGSRLCWWRLRGKRSCRVVPWRGRLIIPWYVFRVSSARRGMSIYSSTRRPWYCILRVLWYCFIPVVNVVRSTRRSLLSLVCLNAIGLYYWPGNVPVVDRLEMPKIYVIWWPSHQRAGGSLRSDRSMRLSPLPSKWPLEKRPPLACLFCCGRKIACGPPLPGSPNRTCK